MVMVMHNDKDDLDDCWCSLAIFLNGNILLVLVSTIKKNETKETQFHYIL